MTFSVSKGSDQTTYDVLDKMEILLYKAEYPSIPWHDAIRKALTRQTDMLRT
jgi:hypothetical protein